MNTRLHHKTVTVSTNLDARAGRPFDVFTADFQTAGRGRLDHVWQSNAAQNLMFSIVLPTSHLPPPTSHLVYTLPLVVGLAMVKAIESSIVQPSTSYLQPLLKWPNDILVEGRKLAGILCERMGDNVIAGVGVNVNQTAFAPEIADRATSLARLTGRPHDRAALLDCLIASITAYHARWAAEGFAALWPEFAPYDVLKGRMVSVLATDHDTAPITGLCGGIQCDGSLLVGSTPVYAGEAHVCSF